MLREGYCTVVNHKSEINRSQRDSIPPPRLDNVRKTTSEWNVYRTRFLIRARQLTAPLAFVDVLGREHRGIPGDYLVESSDGTRRIAPKDIFEDIYVAMGPADEDAWPPLLQKSLPEINRRRSSSTGVLMA